MISHCKYKAILATWLCVVSNKTGQRFSNKIWIFTRCLFVADVSLKRFEGMLMNIVIYIMLPFFGTELVYVC